ncbi:acyltransferase [Bradyrhizobium sp. STM 3809]|uniref:acyltransferase family protein n=1 Tax=Bradyrhizobium sp. STM 3809 TaxID=551936 RepID=UPI0002408CCD|nr:acyltransferase [Bradyrhizobium sp. STM 3809]CCD99983.1 putative acyltransferase [Bradyrhizobium sp. STM 3809]
MRNDRDGLWPLLAGFRFAFSLWVLCAHTYSFAEHPLPVPSVSGAMPVLCFFAISGFSIHHSIATEPAGYLRRRFWRVYPTNFATVSMALVAYLILGPELKSAVGHAGGEIIPPLTWIGSYLLLQTVLPIMVPLMFPAWSLSIEVAYYALAPLLRRASLRMLLVISALSLLGFCGLHLLKGTVLETLVFQKTVFFHALSIFWAFACGWIAYANAGRVRLMLIFAASAPLAVASYPPFFNIEGWFTIMATLLAWFVVVAILFLQPTLAFRRPVATTLNYLGDLGYPLYLSHYPVMFIVASTLLRDQHARFDGVIYGLCAFVVAIAIYHIVDRPLRRFGRSAPPLVRAPLRNAPAATVSAKSA